MQRLSISSFLLFIVTVTASLVSADGGLEHCHDGFMEQELLQSKSALINENNELGNNSVHLLSEGTKFKHHTMPSLNFSCAGNITGFLLGVDVRHDGDEYDEFPQIILLDKDISKFSDIDASFHRDIQPLDFQLKFNGVYKIEFTTPLSFKASKYIGVIQPKPNKSVVQFYRQTFHNQVIQCVTNNFMVKENIPNSRILLHPIADNYSCIHGFISENEIFKMAAMISSQVHHEPHYIGKDVFFKQIRFLCSNVSIKSVIIGGTIQPASHTEMPRILIWRNNSVNFSGVISTTLNNSFIQQNTSMMNLYQYDLPVPISVQADDIIGIYQPDIAQAGAVIYYQTYSGPENYFLNDNMLLSAEKNHYPLVSVVIVTVNSMIYAGSESYAFTPQTMSGVTAVSIENVYTLNSLVSDTILNSNSNFAVTSLDTHNTNTSVSTSRNVIAVAATVFVMLLIVVVMIIGIPLVVLLKRKLSFKKGSKDIVNDVYQSPSNMANPVYGEKLINSNEDNDRSTDNVPYEPITNTYSQVGQSCVDDSQCKLHPPRYTAVNDLYEMIDSQDSVKDDLQEDHYHRLQFGLCVPTKEQREKFNCNQKLECNDLEDGNVDAIYSMAHDVSSEDLQVHFKNSAYGEFTTQFTCVDTCFTEDPIYWEPELNTEGIYEQLAQKKYREIPQKELNVVKNIRSGQFGKVVKGKWTFNKNEIDVAIKTLKSSATEEDEVKFLQEAAINGQFHHPNIITLLGVVTIGKPTMIVLEFMCNGDLKQFLEAKQPLPGELPHQSIQSMLYKFSIQVAKGMKYLSGKKFVHRDLAARNILVGDDNICKIADFGMSRDLQDETYYVSNANKIPVKWTAPEALHYKKYSCQSDVWSFGALLYEIWSVGHKPFEQNTNRKCIELVDAGYRLPPPPACPKRIYKVMINCWHPEASKRPTFALLEEQLIGFKTESPPEVMIGLGGPLDMESPLFLDLQNAYK